MGCTLSLKNPGQAATPNVFKVFNVDDSGQDRNPGRLEVTEHALVLHQKGKEPVGWPLRGLRRYGFDADLFSFESGRRCPTGPGIYAFRCQQAEALFNLLQGYITLAGHVDQQRRTFGGGQPPFDPQTPGARHETNRANFAPVNGLAVGSPPARNGHMPLSEYRNLAGGAAATPGGFGTPGQPLSPRITLARLPDILAMSQRQRRTVDPVIHYADLDLSDRAGDEDPDVFPDENDGGTPRHSASDSTCYINVSTAGALARTVVSRDESVAPVRAYANLDLISSSACAPVSKMNYIQLDLDMFNDGGSGADGGATCQSPVVVVGSPISPSFRAESPHGSSSQRDSYTTIDFDRTRALNAISVDSGGSDEGGLRKTRHNSNIEMLSLN